MGITEKEKDKKEEKGAASSEEPGFFASFGLGKEKDTFLENISMLIASGMPILDAMDAVSEEIVSVRFKKVVLQMKENIVAGYSMSDSFEKTGIFSPHAISLIRIGEKSGRLVDNLKVVAAEQEKERSLRSKIRSATMYPVFVLGLTLIVGIGISWFILPKLAVVFHQLDIDLPWVTRVLIGFGIFLGQHGAIVVPIFLAFLGALGYFVFVFKRTRFIGQAILFHIPGVRDLMKQAELARFGYLLGTLLSAGVSVNESLDSIAKASSLTKYSRFYAYLEKSILEGNSFKRSFAEYPGLKKLVPASIQQLIISGEHSGTLSDTLKKIGRTYEEKTDATAKDLTIILEPILLVIVWVGVVSVALAVILPIYSLVGNLNVN